MYWNGIEKATSTTLSVEFSILKFDAQDNSSDERDKRWIGVEQLSRALQPLHRVDPYGIEKMVASTG